MLSELSQLIPVGGAIKNIATALVQERDREKLAALKLELTDKILDLQTKLLEVHGAVVLEGENLRLAKERIRELESNEREKSRYELAELGAIGNVFAYRLRPKSELTERQTEPPHFVCQPCFDSGKKAVLLINTGEAFCPCCQLRVALQAGKGRARLSAGIG